MRKLLHQFAIQRAISDIGFREGVLYVSVQDDQFMILAHTDSGLIGKGKRILFWKTAFKNPKPLFRLRKPSKEEEFLKWQNPSLSKEKPMGIIRIGYSPKGNPFRPQAN